MNAKHLRVNHICLSENNIPCGSAHEDLGPVLCGCVLSPEQIMQKHGITILQFEQVKKRVQRTSVIDAVFHWPSALYHDVLVWLVMCSR